MTMSAGGPYDSGMEVRVARLEEEMRDVKSAVSRLEATTTRIEAMLAATLPHLATKAEVAELRADLAEKPSKTYMWGVLAALLTAYGCGLAALAVLK